MTDRVLRFFGHVVYGGVVLFSVVCLIIAHDDGTADIMLFSIGIIAIGIAWSISMVLYPESYMSGMDKAMGLFGHLMFILGIAFCLGLVILGLGDVL